jgi:pimeloyl-ACP methyl ester carboxylesterase
MNFIELDGVRIGTLSEGVGEPALVLVHGFACAHDDWRHQIERFKPQRRVVAMDLRGHGSSTGRAADCTLERLARDVAALLEALGLRRCVLVGHSMGCRVVLEAYAHAAERVAGVVLVDGSRLGTQPEDEAKMRQLIESMHYPAFARALFGEALLPPTPAGQEIIERAARLPPQLGATLFSTMVGWDASRMEAAVSAVAAPLLAIQSTYLNPQRKRVHLEPGQSSPWLDLVRRRAPHARVEIVPNAGHFTVLDAPEAFDRVLDGFVRALPAA